MRFLGASVRLRLQDDSGVLEGRQTGPVIFCLWHNRLALSMAIFRRIRRAQPQRRLAALVSASRDGALLARILESFGVQPVRGSSSRRGAQALLELTTWAEQGYDLAITPDGPRGPRYVIQEGVITLAQLTGLPIVPVSYYAHRKVCLKSWDRFQIPLPLAKCAISLGEPLVVPNEAGAAEKEALREELEKRLREASRD